MAACSTALELLEVLQGILGALGPVDFFQQRAVCKAFHEAVRLGAREQCYRLVPKELVTARPLCNCLQLLRDIHAPAQALSYELFRDERLLGAHVHASASFQDGSGCAVLCGPDLGAVRLDVWQAPNVRRRGPQSALRWAFTELAPPPLPRQFGFAAAELLPDETLVVFGGEDEGLPGFSSDEVFLLPAKRSAGSPSSLWSGPLPPLTASGPSARGASASCVTGNSLCIFGGFHQYPMASSGSAGTMFHGDLWLLEIAPITGCGKQQAVWSSMAIQGASPCARAYAAMEALDTTHVLLHGGQRKHGEYLSDLWILTLQPSLCSCRAEQVIQTSPVPRMSHTLHALGNLIVILGGADRMAEGWDVSSSTVLTGVLDRTALSMGQWRVADCMDDPRDSHFSFALKSSRHLFVGAGDSGTDRDHEPLSSLVDVELFFWN